MTFVILQEKINDSVKIEDSEGRNLLVSSLNYNVVYRDKVLCFFAIGSLPHSLKFLFILYCELSSPYVLHGIVN